MRNLSLTSTESIQTGTMCSWSCQIPAETSKPRQRPSLAQGAINVMEATGVDVILGVSGDPEAAALAYVACKLTTDPDAVKECGGC